MTRQSKIRRTSDFMTTNQLLPQRNGTTSTVRSVRPVSMGRGPTVRQEGIDEACPVMHCQNLPDHLNLRALNTRQCSEMTQKTFRRLKQQRANCSRNQLVPLLDCHKNAGRLRVQLLEGGDMGNSMQHRRAPRAQMKAKTMKTPRRSIKLSTHLNNRGRKWQRRKRKRKVFLKIQDEPAQLDLIAPDLIN